MKSLEDATQYWYSLKWYWKILTFLIILRILNIFYRFIFESASSKKRRQMIESGEIDLKKIYKMKMEMKNAEAETKENFEVPLKISQIDGRPVEETLGVLGATLAFFNIMGEKFIEWITYFKDYIYNLLYASLNKLTNNILL